MIGRNRRGRGPRSAILQSSALGLMHFPTASLETPPGAAEQFLQPQGIVVGVTHGRACRNALRWAARAALSADTTLSVVTAYTVPCPLPTMYGWAYVDEQAADATARFMQGNVLHDELRGHVRSRRIHAVVARGDAARVLVAASSRADLLVLGQRDGRRRPSLARSVGADCMKSAQCPVVVIREGLREPPLSAAAIHRLFAPAGGLRDLAAHARRDRNRATFEHRRNTQ